MSGLETIGGSVLTLPDCGDHKGEDEDSYKFTGWLCDSKGYQPGDRFTMPTRNVTFTAQWQEVFAVSGTIAEKTSPETTKAAENAVVSLWLGTSKKKSDHRRRHGLNRGKNG